MFQNYFANVYQDIVAADVSRFSPSGQNGRHFADYNFRCIFVNENFCILIKKKSLKFVLNAPIDNNPAFLDNGLAPNRWQAIIWTNADLIHWRIYVTLGGDELKLKHGIGGVYKSIV